MPFDLKITNQSSILENRFKSSLYKSLHKASAKTNWIRLSGIGVGVVSGLSTIATRVALIGECLIKGLGNIFGAAFSDKLSFKTGVSQILCGLTENIIILPFSIASAALGMIGKPLLMLSDPKKYTLERWYAHDPIEKDNAQKAQQAAKLKDEKIAFDRSLAAVQSDPKNVFHLKSLASCYESGKGTSEDIKEAFKYYKLAADEGDLDAMTWVSAYHISSSNGDKNEAFNLSKKAAEKNHAYGLCLLGNCYDKGFGVTSDEKEAIKLYHKAVQHNNPEAMIRLGVKYVQGKIFNQNNKHAKELFKNAMRLGNLQAKNYLAALLMLDKELKLSMDNTLIDTADPRKVAEIISKEFS